MIDYQNIGKRIRHLREKKNLTQEDLADIAGCSRVYISYIESGKNVSLETVVAIANGMDVSIEEILADSMEVTNQKFDSEIDEILVDCTPETAEIIIKCAKHLKKILDGYTIK